MNLKQYAESLNDKALKIAEKLATRAAVQASHEYSSAIYTGTNDVSVDVERTADGYAVTASGNSVLFIEFGSGITYGYGHPQADEFGYGPGTWDGKGHWDNEKGWYTPDGEHTFGNPPSMTMYRAAAQARRDIQKVAKEVLSE